MEGALSDYNNLSPPVIPVKLEAAGFRFIRIAPRSKSPVDREYPTTRNYSTSDREIQSWLNTYHSYEIKTDEKTPSGEALYSHSEGYGNYGALGSETNIILDLDSQELIDLLFSDPILFNTYLCQSGSGEGLHAYYRTDKGRTIPLRDVSGINIGHIKAGGGYCVGPNSHHPSGGCYVVVKDDEIATVPFDHILKVFGPYIGSKQLQPSPKKAHSSHFHSETIDIPITSIMMPIQRNGESLVTKPGEIVGSHPLHGSTGGRNLAVNTSKNTWYCNRCHAGGGPAEAIAVMHGLINCEDAQHGCLRGDLFRSVMEIAERQYGYTRPIKQPPRSPEMFLSPGTAFGLFDEPNPTVLPDAIPDVDIALIDALPRIGKSHWSELRAIESGSANIVANTHSVIEHHLRIFRENRNPGQTAVHLEGKQRCCNHVVAGRRKCSCKKCDFYPYSSDPSDRGKFLAHVYEVLNHEGILTRANVPRFDCNYYFLKEAAKNSDYVFTVIENLDEISGKEHTSRHLTIIDEDTCFSHFFPRSAELAEFTRVTSRYHVSSDLEQKWHGIEKFRTYLNKKRQWKGKDTVLRIISILEQIRDIIRITDDTLFNPTTVMEKLSELDTSVPDPADSTRINVLREIERWETPDTLSSYASALLFPYKERFFDWQGHSHMKLRMIADEEQIVAPVPETKMLLIGSTRARLFMKAIPDKKQATIKIDSFPKSPYFLFLKVVSDQTQATSHSQKVLPILRSMNRVNEKVRYPALVLTGNKRDQAMVVEDLGGIAKGSSNENEIGQIWNLHGGFLNVFYQNSVISRGVDVPFFRSMFMVSSDFASPYWTAKQGVAIEAKDKSASEEAELIRDAITVDETTNSILRITPTPTTEDDIPRVIVIDEKDWWKIKEPVYANATVVEVTTDQAIDWMTDIYGIIGTRNVEDTSGLITPDNKDFDGKSVEVKCEMLSRMVGSRKPKARDWGKGYNDAFVDIVVAATVQHVKSDYGEGEVRMDVLTKWVVDTRPTRITPEFAERVIAYMIDMGMMRIGGIGEGRKVRLGSAVLVGER